MLQCIKLNFILHYTSMEQGKKTFELLETFVTFEYIFLMQCCCFFHNSMWHTMKISVYKL